MEKYTCPHCGKDITQIVDAAFREQRSAAGKAKTEKKTAAQKANMAKLNSKYTPAKRKAAAQKRLETLKKKGQKNGKNH